MESIWTTHENPLISNSLFFFFRKKDEERKKYRTTRVGGNVRSPGRVRSFRNFQSQREGARESWEVRSCAFFFFFIFSRAIPIDISRKESTISLIESFTAKEPTIPNWRLDLVSGIPIGRSWSWNIGQSSEFSSEIVDRSMRPHGLQIDRRCDVYI